MSGAALVRRIVGDALLQTVSRMTRGDATPVDDVVLIFQPDHLGDVILSQPAVRLLRAHFPDHRLVGVVGPWSVEIAKLSWEVDDVMNVSFPGFGRSDRVSPIEPYRLLSESARHLRELRAALALILRPDDRWSAALAFAAGIPDVITSDDERVRRFATRFATTSGRSHRSAKALAIARTAADAPVSDETWRSHPLVGMHLNDEPIRVAGLTDGTPYALIHPGSGARVKHWLPHRWRAVVNALERRGLAVIVTGGPAESALCAAICGGTHAINLAGQTNLHSLTPIVAGARVAIGTDNGPMHLAVAVDSPSVHLFGPSDPDEFGPWGDPVRHRVVYRGLRCTSCRDLSIHRPEGCGCMVAISVDDVLSAISLVLD